MTFKLSELLVFLTKTHYLVQWGGHQFQALQPAVRKEITLAKCKRRVELTAKIQSWETKEQFGFHVVQKENTFAK